MANYDVLCIGNAIVDIIARAEEDFLKDNDIIKGAMNLIDADRAELLYERMGPAIESSGGSAGNTAAGIANFGSSAAYFGKVADDHLGKIFRHDIRAQGVAFDTEPLADTPPTARSMIFVTPDGERSMNTYLGACVELSPEDVEEDKAGNSGVVYFEGYLWDPPRAKNAIRKSAEIAHSNGKKVAMSLSDPFCVDRYREEFLELMRSGTVDIIFANGEELKSLYQTADFETALTALRDDCDLAAITKGADGSVIISGDDTYDIQAIEINELVDTTGAGDLYAAGFLHGYSQNLDLDICGNLGSLAAGIIIQQIGPRPQVSLKQAGIDAGLLKA
ncbi:adenosine kinase [Ahrensia marina]|uniref:Carbohydrate kinase n=1 Tax=Ahrensia marina TaxID=1514904 RepID=A0A0M9GNP4_9HYPH|nr:adenosine kinase [Ahrensia marina]KPB02070.1 carbohydrate kinase [Ahrensia marina]